MPQVPDYFGFIFGFLLIWLIYTGYGAVKGVFVQTHKSAIELTAKAKVATKDSVVALQGQAQDLMASNTELVDKAKDKVDQLQSKLARARLASQPKSEVTTKKKNWSSEQLKKANSFINDLISTIGEAIYGTSEEEVVKENATPEPSKEVVNRSDSLEWFQ